MALEFRPPEWLLQEYMNRKRPQDEVADQLNTIANQQMAQRQQEKENALRQQQVGIQQQGNTLKAAEMGYDPNNPSEYWNRFSEDRSLRNDKTLADIDLEKAHADYYRRDPKATDQKKTFQLKGFLAGEDGSQIPVNYDTRTGELVQGSPVQGPVLPTVSPSIPGSEVSKFGDLENMKSKMKVVGDSYDPSFVGMVDSRVQAIKQKTGVGATEKAARFRQAVQDIKDSLLRARSGAQINEQEYQRLLPLVPDETSGEVDFNAKSKRFNEVLDEMISSKKAAFSAAGYRPMAGQSQQQKETPEQRKARLIAEAKGL